MHFTGRTWRPPYEAYSVIIQATSGCTYNKCRFCNLYRDECFRLSPMEEFEEDLAEIKRYQPNARRIFWTGADPFSMSYENLQLRTHLLANSVSNFFPLTAWLPKERDSAVRKLQHVIDTMSEDEMKKYRDSLKSLSQDDL